MRIAGPIVLIVCGILALVGLFLPWVSASFVGWSYSGWDALWEWEPTLVLIGSILLIVCAIPALVLGIVRKARGVVLGMGIVSILASIMVIAGPLYGLIDLATESALSMLGVGVYICIAAAFIAFIFGIVTAAIR